LQSVETSEMEALELLETEALELLGDVGELL
jgi:hypothetical protein